MILPIFEESMHKSQSLIRIFFTLFLILVGAMVLHSYLWYLKYEEYPQIVNFIQLDNNRIQIHFSKKTGDITLVRLKSIPNKIELAEIGAMKLENISSTDDEIFIRLLENERLTEYSLVLIMGDPRCKKDALPFLISVVMPIDKCRNSKYLEIVRQPASWLKKRFKLVKPKGYSILGRHSVETRSGDVAPLSSLVFSGKPNLNLSKISEVGIPEELLAYPELKESVKLIRLLWGNKIHGGPTTVSYGKFLQHSFKDKIKMFGDGSFSIMCQGMRDLFLHSTASIEGIKARAVEAYNYAPQFPDLVSYGHSTAEVWVEKLDKFVLIDPWMGIALINEGGVPMSVEEIAHNNHEKIYVRSLIPNIKRSHFLENGTVHITEIDPDNTELESYSFDYAGHAPGFLVYFRHILYREYTLKDRHY